MSTDEIPKVSVGFTLGGGSGSSSSSSSSSSKFGGFTMKGKGKGKKPVRFFPPFFFLHSPVPFDGVYPRNGA